MCQKDRFIPDFRRHYIRPAPAERVLEALKRAGKDPQRLRPEDLAPIDEFHTMGRAATLELGRIAGITESTTVLDVGCGIGGPARCLAATYGCHVTGVDLLEDYCDTADILTRLTGLSHLIEFRQADALDLPFPDAAYGVVWSQHAAMNIQDKGRLYREMHRVLKRDGTLAIFDVLSNPATPPGPIHFPVPWAQSPEMSFLISPEELRGLLAASGFSIENWVDCTDAALEIFAKLVLKVGQNGLPPLGTHVLLGPGFESMLANQLQNFREKRIVVVQVVAKKVAAPESCG
ncbi:MAG: Glycine/sarcosine/dimethylglycine N-methyltransferase [Syntrophaceae bacterium PtaU1.Bin231]|nr:MAG: Glycine/sarcosine/dimethylglycine N-methyltransferase [Syntrophaceae bacterium PtaU1.Bin231]